jgi:hypothetical protein
VFERLFEGGSELVSAQVPSNLFSQRLGKIQNGAHANKGARVGRWNRFSRAKTKSLREATLVNSIIAIHDLIAITARY